MLNKKLPIVIEDFLREKNLFPHGNYRFVELKPAVDDLSAQTNQFTDVSYFKIEKVGKSGCILIENQDGDLKIIKNDLSDTTQSS